MISIYKRRRIRSIALCIGYVVLILVAIFGLTYTPLLSARTVSVSAPTDELTLRAQKEIDTLLEKKYLGLPGRAVHLFWQGPIEDIFLEYTAVKDVSTSWDWFNVLSVNIREHVSFAYFCLNNATQYQGDCAVFDEEGTKFATGLTYSTDGLIHLVHKNLKDGEFLSPKNFKVLTAAVKRLRQDGITVKQVEVEAYGEQSTILTLQTVDRTKIHINPHKEKRTLFALDKALLWIERSEEGGLASIARLHLYDPTRIAYWRAGEEAPLKLKEEPEQPVSDTGEEERQQFAGEADEEAEEESE